MNLIKKMIKHNCCLECINSETCHLNETEYTIEQLKGLCKILDKENGWFQTDEEKDKIRKDYDYIDKKIDEKYNNLELLKKDIKILEEKKDNLLEKILGVETYY